MNHNLQIQKILLAVESSKDNEDKIKLLKQAISIADANNDLDWGYELRFDLMYEEKGTSHCIDSIPAFVWIMNTVDANPVLFEESEILLRYKWMLAAVQRSTSFPLEQIYSIREDFKQRMERNGHGLYTYYNLLHQWYLIIGDSDKAREYQELRNAEQPDNISYCLACDIDTDAELELLDKNWDKAITVADDLLSGRETCFYEPFSVLSKMVYHFTKNRDDRAGIYYQKAEDALSELESTEPYNLLNIAYIILYAGLYQKERAWQLFELYSKWDVNSEDYYAFYFASSLLPLFKDRGERKLSISPELPYFSEDETYDTQVLYNYYLNRASQLADRFDKRNGNSYFTQTLELIKTF